MRLKTPHFIDCQLDSSCVPSAAAMTPFCNFLLLLFLLRSLTSPRHHRHSPLHLGLSSMRKSSEGDQVLCRANKKLSNCKETILSDLALPSHVSPSGLKHAAQLLLNFLIVTVSNRTQLGNTARI